MDKKETRLRRKGGIGAQYNSNNKSYMLRSYKLLA